MKLRVLLNLNFLFFNYNDQYSVKMKSFLTGTSLEIAVFLLVSSDTFQEHLLGFIIKYVKTLPVNLVSCPQINNGRICGDISVSRSFGDMRFKNKKNE